MNQPRVMIMAGGTGGHIFPAMAIANALYNNGWRVYWLGSRNGMETELVPHEKFQLHLLSVSGLRGNGLVGWLKAPWMLLKSVIDARQFLTRNQIQLAIGFGGFASGPGGLACVLSRVPLYLHEQNAKAGMTNQKLARFASIVFEGFPGTFNQNLVKKLMTVGNPVRDEIVALKKSKPKHSVSRILVVGGSRGAQALNEFLPSIFSKLIDENQIEVWHQTGRGKLESTKQNYEKSLATKPNNMRVTEFINDMTSAYQWADLIICRAGASTVAEIAAVGLAAIFVPYPFAVDDHQAANAHWLVKTGGASLLRQSELEAGEKGLINAWIKKSPAELYELGQLNKQKALINATTDMVKACENFRSEAA